jgi:hypothetical protein
VFARSIARDRVYIFPDELVFLFPELWVHKEASSRVPFPLKCFPEVVLEIAPLAMWICHPPELPSSNATAITIKMLHLSSAPYKALRFATPAHARGLRALTVPARR